MGRPMTPDQIKATADAKLRAETAEYKNHLKEADAMQPVDKPPVHAPLPPLDPLAGQS